MVRVRLLYRFLWHKLVPWDIAKGAHDARASYVPRRQLPNNHRVSFRLVRHGLIGKSLFWIDGTFLSRRTAGLDPSIKDGKVYPLGLENPAYPDVGTNHANIMRANITRNRQ